MGIADKAGNGSDTRQKIACAGNAFITCVRLSGGRVDEAWSTGKMVRDTKALLKRKVDSRGRPQFVQQPHCLCNDGHALAAARAIENLAGMEPPRAALLVRSLIQALRTIQEHLLHVYQFNLSDWASLSRALRADPAKAARLYGDQDRDVDYFRMTQVRLSALADSLGPGEVSGKTGLCLDFHGPDEFHLALYAHGFDSLATGGRINEALKLLGCKGKMFMAYQAGGLPENMDLGEDMRQRLREILEFCLDFVERIFLADLELIASVYPHWAKIGAGQAFMSCGDHIRPFAQGPLFPGGVVLPGGGGGSDSWVAYSGDGRITEERQPDWQQSDLNRYRLDLGRPGPEFHWTGGGLKWLPAPRHEDDACEVGPLARILGAWIYGREDVLKTMGRTLRNTGLALPSMNSTLGRCLARGIESVVLARTALNSLEELGSVVSGGEQRLRTDLSLPVSGVGKGRVEVPRGTLVHTIRLEDGRITTHDHLIPTLWNFSPRDSSGKRGPLETSLVGTPVSSPDDPVEILRTVHALDPCNICQVVVDDSDTGQTTVASAK